jgi:transcriptional regulator with XRE-family HTH domain
MQDKEFINNSKKVYGQNLKACREDAKLTQKQLADKLRIPRTEITMIENGQRFPKYSRHLDLCNALELDYISDFPYFQDDVTELKQQLEIKDKQLEIAEQALIDTSEHRISEIGYDDDEDSILEIVNVALAEMEEVNNG